jgi:hypothetical protein
VEDHEETHEIVDHETVERGHLFQKLRRDNTEAETHPSDWW